MKVLRLFYLAAAVFGLLAAIPGLSQSITSGDIAGTLTDPSGAVVPNAKVTVTSSVNGVVHTATSSNEGFYRFSFLSPGAYTVSVSASGFQPASVKVQVAVGQVANGSISLTITEASTTVEVTAPPIQIENGDLSTAFSVEQVSSVPNPGNDLSAVAQTSPGVVMNTQSGFGNFSSFGLPATSNLFTLNGQNDNDPFLNLNNSGATNLLLGANEVQETTVTSNGYSGQYGQLAGAQVNYVTKSGGNQFHGNGIWYWNGRVLNANDFFNNAAGTPRPFDNVNQWAASISGPIVKDKTFFFWNYEGLRVVLPTSNAAFIPTQQFANATLARVGAVNPTELPFYQNMFNLYAKAPGAAGAVAQPVSGDCNNISTVFPSLFPSGTPCVAKFQSTAGNFTHEYLTALRIDHKFNENDSIWGRVQNDHGLQATLTDVINPLFNLQSDQPEYQGQMGWTHIVNSNQVNEFKASGLWYSAIFTSANRAATLAAFPTNLQLGDGAFSALGGGVPSQSFLATDVIFPSPQGRKVNQYQIVDDYSWTHGQHTWKFGANFHRNNVTDEDPLEVTNGLVTVGTLADFFNGGNASQFTVPGSTGPVPIGTGTSLTQNFPSRLSQPINIYGLAVYLQDEWRVNKKLKVTLALRLDHNSNPTCGTDCFARLTSPFTTLNHTGSADVPYNQTILTGFNQAYPSTDIVVWQPRFGFAYSPRANNKTVIRGGIGIFSDSFPGQVADTLLFNAPTLGVFTVNNASNNAPIFAGPNSNDLFTLASQANQSFQQGFAGGLSFNQIRALNPNFTAPNFTTTDPRVRQPRYQEWNLEVEQELPWSTVLSVNYVGNHGIFEDVQNGGLNGFAPPALAGFVALPSVAPDARFGVVTQIQSIGRSNYNGLITSLRHQFNRGFAFQVNYGWSHALDNVSNGGLLPFSNSTNLSTLIPTNPSNVRQNYGSSDYDIRHYFSANYVWDNALRHLFHWGPNAVFGGWTFSGTVFARSGLPFSVIDGAADAALAQANFPQVFPEVYQLLATVTGNPSSGIGCSGTKATTTPCLAASSFLGATQETGFGNQARNSFRGPGYFDTDFTVMKYNKITERTSLGLGVQFFNLLNHPNFDQPVNDISNPNFGTIIRSVNTPTSILGSALGGDAAPRLIQVKAEFKF